MKTYIASINAYNGRVIRYKDENQAIAQGVKYILQEAESWSEAKDKIIERYTIENQKEEE